RCPSSCIALRRTIHMLMSVTGPRVRVQARFRSSEICQRPGGRHRLPGDGHNGRVPSPGSSGRPPSDLASHLTGERAESMFRGLLEAAPDAMVIVDAEGRIVLVNRQAEQLYGCDREELLGQPVEILVPATLRERHRAHRTAYSADPQ